MRTSRSLVAGALVLGVLAAAGCGGSSSDGGATSASAAKATVRSLELSGFGKVVADTQGKPLYVITSDPAGGSSCSGSCLKGTFAPAKAPGSLTAGPGLEASELKSISGAGGGKQLAFNGHALYRYTGEGLISGAGETSGKGTWYLLSAKGTPIKTTAAGGY